jgi:hypothetical protein
LRAGSCQAWECLTYETRPPMLQPSPGLWYAARLVTSWEPVSKVVPSTSQGIARMSGGYIHCAGFSGDDKSGSAITGVLDSLGECMPESDRAAFHDAVLNPICKAIREASDHILIEAEIVGRLKSPLDELYSRLGSELDHPEPSDAPQFDDDQGLDPIEAKWGKGKGWQYYCAHDLRLACEASLASGQPICISFD